MSICTDIFHHCKCFRSGTTEILNLITSGSSITTVGTLILILQSESFHVTPDKGMFWDQVRYNDVWCAYHVKLWLLLSGQKSLVSTATCAINTMEQLISHKSTIPIICAPNFLLILQTSQTVKTDWQASLKKENLSHQSQSCFDRSHPWDLPPLSLALQS